MGNSDNWIPAWWQPLTAIQPGIAEEAWGRVFLIPLLFLMLRPVADDRRAFTASLVVMACWFAYLHTPGGAGTITGTLVMGSLYALPLSHLCFYRDLETAIGFHFWVDYTRFAWAFTFFKG